MPYIAGILIWKSGICSAEIPLDSLKIAGFCYAVKMEFHILMTTLINDVHNVRDNHCPNDPPPVDKTDICLSNITWQVYTKTNTMRLTTFVQLLKLGCQYAHVTTSDTIGLVCIKLQGFILFLGTSIDTAHHNFISLRTIMCLFYLCFDKKHFFIE